MEILKPSDSIEKIVGRLLPFLFLLLVVTFVFLIAFDVTFPTLNIEKNEHSPKPTLLFPAVGLIISVQILLGFLVLRRIRLADVTGKIGSFEKYYNILSYCLILIGYVFSFYRGFRMPNLWSMGYFVPGYWDGIYRRALAGTLLSLFGDLRFDYYFIMSIQAAIFLAFHAILLREMIRSNFAIRFVFAFFLLSPAGGYWFHEIGYIDQLLFLIILICILSKNSFVPGLLVGVSPLFHEQALLIILPVYLLSLYFKEDGFSRWWFLPFILAFVSFFICLSAPIVGLSLAEFVNNWKLHANYFPRLDYVNDALIAKTTRFMAMHYAEDQIPILVLTVIVGIFASWTVALSNSAKTRNILFGLGVICFLSPLLLGLVGWDTSRWIFLSLVSSLFVFYLGRDSLKENLFYGSVFALVLLTAVGNLRYFDGYRPRKVSINSVQQFIESGFIQESTRIPKL